MFEKIYFQILKLLNQNPSGLVPMKEEDYKDDFPLGSIFDFFGDYTPKVSDKVIKTISNKDQKRLSNCSFQAATVQKEVDEEVELSARYLTAKAYQQGLCGKGGWANMKAGQEVLRKFGCCEEKDCPSNSNLSWDQYVNIDFSKLDPLAAKHKTKSYWRIYNINEFIKAVEGNHIVTIGIDWYSGFNQGGGFKAPWIISGPKGYKFSGHAMAGKGYKDKSNLGHIQNSYSKLWGDNGDLYIDYNWLDSQIRRYGAYANLDIEYDKVSAEDIIEKYDWAKSNKVNVRGNKQGAIYMIYDGRKYAYRNARAFVAYNGKPYDFKNMFVTVPQEAIDDVPDGYGGGLLDGSGGDYWEVAKNLKDPINENFKK